MIIIIDDALCETKLSYLQFRQWSIEIDGLK